MTETKPFRQVYEAFRVLPYPDYPHDRELQDWNSHLLTLDGWIAGYASRIASGSMAAAEVPEVSTLVRQVGDLRRKLDEIASRLEEDRQLVEKYRSYVAALHSLISEIGALENQDHA
ncbi:hypothetical protein [Streptomyces sp. G7(2002)]|uniref:hypothetical protein n=1 Tax=Streptomyces sp. G7(2002) TaxID=2971798 RepID=UPI00237E4847|nr:hypothetical protein [Streptomyces sp. G7(2002)]WDT53550.1 hypothetical protein NUT86_05545 [Streptomyces sp. G7(2002)]